MGNSFRGTFTDPATRQVAEKGAGVKAPAIIMYVPNSRNLGSI